MAGPTGRYSHAVISSQLPREVWLQQNSAETAPEQQIAAESRSCFSFLVKQTGLKQQFDDVLSFQIHPKPRSYSFINI